MIIISLCPGHWTGGIAFVTGVLSTYALLPRSNTITGKLCISVLPLRRIITVTCPLLRERKTNRQTYFRIYNISKGYGDIARDRLGYAVYRFSGYSQHMAARGEQRGSFEILEKPAF